MKHSMTHLRNALFALSVLAAGTAFAAGPNLVSNGGFENALTDWAEIKPDGNRGAVNFQNRYLDNPCGASAIAPENGCGGNNYGLQVFQGKYASAAGTNTEGVKQTIDGLTVGHEYTLRFYTTGSDFVWAGENVYWQVSFGSQTKDGNLWTAPPGELNTLFTNNWKRTDADGDSINANFRWVATNLTFVAAAETQVLKFQQKTKLDSAWDTSVTPYGTPTIMLLDGITLTDNDYVTPAVPEPSTAGMGLAGLTLLGFLVSRRRRKER